MAEFRVRLFGKFDAERNGRIIEGIQARKVQELFSYLLIFRNHPQPREVLCEVLWGNQPASKARKYLRQTLWRLQLALNDAANANKPDIVADSDWIQISPSASFRLDISEFGQVFNAFNDKDPRDLSSKDFKTIRSAINLYRGDLLEGWYQDWCLFERERFQIMHLTLLDKLVQYCEMHGHYAAGLAYGTDILRHDHAYERTHRQMMRLYSMAGNRTQALHQYQRCVTALRNELDIEPSESTKQLYEEIRSDTFDSSLPSGKEAIHEIMEPAQTLSRILNRLEHFSDELNKIRFRIEKESTALGSTSSTPE
ncbi:MAG: bacterial transcriptional activator domain-containing protein [Anaerolineales bacterium]|nr:bacterial transcriptional activator domain-containing protein [Anaerolineales bacterium]